MVKKTCPHCATVLVPRRARGALFYCCERCYGFTFRMDDIARLDDSKTAAELWRASSRSVGPATVNCPHCRNLMRPASRQWCDVVHEGEKIRCRVEVDVCRLCHIGWMGLADISELKNPAYVAPQPYSRAFYQNYARVLVVAMNEGSEMAAAFTIGEAEIEDPWQLARALLGALGAGVPEKSEVLVVKPFATWFLMAGSCAVSLWAFSHMDFAVEMLALHAHSSWQMRIVESVTSFFLHANWLHLAFNMFSLWAFGPSVENYLGRLRFFALIILASALGGFITMSLDTRVPDQSLIGASGGIFGLIAFYCVRFWHRRLAFGTLLVPAWLAAIGLSFLQWIHALGQIAGAIDPVSYLDHIGGGIVGAIFGLCFRWPYYVRMEWTPDPLQVATGPVELAPAQLDPIESAPVAKKRFGGAWRAYFVVMAFLAAVMAANFVELHKHESAMKALALRIAQVCAAKFQCTGFVKYSDECVERAYDLHDVRGRYSGLISRAGFYPLRYVNCMNTRAGKEILNESDISQVK